MDAEHVGAKLWEAFLCSPTHGKLLFKGQRMNHDSSELFLFFKDTGFNWDKGDIRELYREKVPVQDDLENPPQVVCHVCGKPAMNRCASCHQIDYCSKSCQTADWKQHRHACSLPMETQLFWRWFACGRSDYLNSALALVLAELTQKNIAVLCAGSRVVHVATQDLCMPLKQELFVVFEPVPKKQVVTRREFREHFVDRLQHQSGCVHPLTCSNPKHSARHTVCVVTVEDGRDFVLDLTSFDADTSIQKYPWTQKEVALYDNERGVTGKSKPLSAQQKRANYNKCLVLPPEQRLCNNAKMALQLAAVVLSAFNNKT